MSLYRLAGELEERGEKAALCMVIKAQGSTPRHVGSKMLVFPDGRIEGSVGGGEMEGRIIAEALEVMEQGAPRVLTYSLSDPERGDPGVCGGKVEVYVEPITAKATIMVIGAGHVGRAVVHLAKWLGFRVVVVDDRPELGTKEQFPEADEIHSGDFTELAKTLEVTEETYLVLTTRNVDVDMQILPALLETPASYFGVIGSRRRWQTTREQLKELGIPEEKINQVISPMGLDIHAETPEEIAVSIMGQIIARRGGEGD